MEITFGKPYEDSSNIREFDVKRDDAEYVWHKDPENRECEILEGDGWQFQYENALPWAIHPGMIFEILPFIVLFASLSTFFVLARRSELIIARASGISIWRLLFPGVSLIMIIGLFTVTIYSFS